MEVSVGSNLMTAIEQTLKVFLGHVLWCINISRVYVVGADKPMLVKNTSAVGITCLPAIIKSNRYFRFFKALRFGGFEQLHILERKLTNMVQL